jgi:dihydroorotate dehydrogenase electron transfer subunit
MVYACGPQAMLRQIVGISRAHKIAVQVSVEERMACGVGACGGCALPTHAGMKRVCSNGPVFFGEEIVW